MTRKAVGGIAAVLMVAGLMAAPALAQSGGKWLHVRVVEGGEGGETVKVNLPIAVLETMADAIEAEHFKEGLVHMGETHLTAEQLRAIWQSLKTTKDMEFVTVESSDENVRVAKSGGFLLVKVREGAGKGEGESVDIKVPLPVVDALLEAPEGRLNIKGALQALVQHGQGDLVVVDDGRSKVRIWIDDRSESEV